RRLIEVDHVDAEALQRVGGEIFNRRRPAVESQKAPRKRPHGAELDAQEDRVAPSGDGLADQRLVVAHAVEVAGVEQRNPAIESLGDRRETLRIVAAGLRAVEIRHAHTAKAEGGNSGSMVSEVSDLHREGPPEVTSHRKMLL